MTVVRVRSHPGLFIQDCLQALPLVPWALSSSSCVLWFPLPLVLKVSQYILYQSVVLFLLIIIMNYYSQSTVYIKVYSWCCTTMHVYVIHSTFWYPGLLRTLFIWCLWSRLWHRTPLFVREVADADGFGTPWRAWGLMTDGLCAPWHLCKTCLLAQRWKTAHLGTTGVIFIWRLESKKDKSHCHYTKR